MERNKEKILENKPGINLERFVFKMVEELSKRPRDIIVKRFNFNGDKKAKTLEEVGEEYKITRERVRQIEFEAMSKLKDIGRKHKINEIFESIENNLKNRGGFASEKKIISHLFDEENGGKINRQITLFILSLDDKIKEKRETKIHKKIYFYEEEDIEKFKNVIGKIEEHLEKNKKDLDFNEMLEIVNEHFRSKGKFSPLHLKSYLDENKVILRNILGRWGHIKWPHINPKNVKDKAYLTLKKNKKPLHFVEITNGINKLWQNDRIANNQTVHNELIKDDRFVLIGRGIYALKEWGYSAGTVLDVIIETLKENDDKMKKSDIMQEVLKKRKVRNNTIVLNLQNKECFERLPNGVYRLR